MNPFFCEFHAFFRNHMYTFLSRQLYRFFTQTQKNSQTCQEYQCYHNQDNLVHKTPSFRTEFRYISTGDRNHTDFCHHQPYIRTYTRQLHRIYVQSTLCLRNHGLHRFIQQFRKVVCSIFPHYDCSVQ